MSFFISDALAEGGAAAGQQPSMLEALLPFVILFIVFYFLLIRPQSKRAKEHKAMVEAIGKGDEVATSGGILGKVTEVGEEFIEVEIADNTRIKLQRGMIGQLLPKGTIKNMS